MLSLSNSFRYVVRSAHRSTFKVPDGMLLNCFSIVPRISEQIDMSARVVRLLRCYVLCMHIKSQSRLNIAYGLRREASEIAEGVFTHSLSIRMVFSAFEKFYVYRFNMTNT